MFLSNLKPFIPLAVPLCRTVRPFTVYTVFVAVLSVQLLSVKSHSKTLPPVFSVVVSLELSLTVVVEVVLSLDVSVTFVVVVVVVSLDVSTVVVVVTSDPYC